MAKIRIPATLRGSANPSLKSSPGTVTRTIKRDGDGLYRQVPGWFAQAIFPESETVFSNATEDEQLSFNKNDKGEVTGVIAEQNGTFGESGRKEFKVEK